MQYVRSGRFSDISIHGALGRKMLARGMELLTKSTGTTFYVVSLDHDAVYQRVFGSPWVNAGMFRGSDAEELLFVFSEGMPHGVFISLDSSTTDPTGQSRLLRSAAPNRQAWFQAVYGMETKLYGSKNSYQETLAQQSTMDTFSLAFADYGVNERVEQPVPWRVPGAHAGVIGPQPLSDPRPYPYPYPYPSPSPSPSPSRSPSPSPSPWP